MDVQGRRRSNNGELQRVAEIVLRPSMVLIGD